MQRGMNLNRADVLQLVSVVSGSSSESLTELLDFFCHHSPHIRFASLWRLGRRTGTISIQARSSFDYMPQLGDDLSGLQEFLCETSCNSVHEIVESEEFLSGNRKNLTIPINGEYDKFHPQDVVKEHKLSQFIALPIYAGHQPDLREARFFCLLYCNEGVEAKAVPNDDTALIMQCVGNMIFNVFSQRRHEITTGLTAYLASHHTQTENGLLEYLHKNTVSCELAFIISATPNGSIEVANSPLNQVQVRVPRKLAKFVLKESPSGEPWLLADCKTTQMRSAISYKPNGNQDSHNLVFLFCNKTSACPNRQIGCEKFPDHFGFDDLEVLKDVGTHIRAYTETLAEERRRDDLLRIVAHETKQPALDIWNMVLSHKRFPNSSKFSYSNTLRVVEDNAELSFALAEMNMDFGGDSILLSMGRDCQVLDVHTQMMRFRSALQTFGDDCGFDHKQILVQTSETCRKLRIQRSAVAALFINMVTNSMKYNHRAFGEGWCSVKMQWASGKNDPIWREIQSNPKSLHSGLLLTVTDNGLGIDKESQPFVFRRHFRADRSNGVRGLGLGLFRVSELVKAYGGEIWLNSRPPAENSAEFSTRFSIVIPREKVAL
ncbi:sensor histidine kinase KdpD [uncultured Roseobacter sp.]|uniref:sensor histidine kinase n=1 Tax=uncultured Roseobacter sp. TaxID=114847 RepID=UPI0026349AAB|nr:sensor histidine kinase [uncultured Roseobacter sp.]